MIQIQHIGTVVLNDCECVDPLVTVSNISVNESGSCVIEARFESEGWKSNTRTIGTIEGVDIDLVKAREYVEEFLQQNTIQ
jgi:hypothetical protein